MQPNEILKFFAAYIERELGIIYAEHNNFQLESRLQEIAKLQGVATLEELYKNAQAGIQGVFKQLLLDLATNNETSFFRDNKVFKGLESQVLAKLKSGDSLNIWSAASSTGQEALSLAMMIEEYCLKNKVSLSYSILATDISERVLERAKAACYFQLEVQRGLPAPYLVKYFKKEADDRWTAAPQLRSKIEYRKLNLKEAFSFPRKFQLILCRNVLIYQNVEGKKDILGKITAALDKGGCLVLGSGESLLGLSNDYEQANQDGAILYLKKGQEQKVA